MVMKATLWWMRVGYESNIPGGRFSKDFKAGLYLGKITAFPKKK